ncbi:unnamed protein product [Schistosoma mattheei]|uniref:Uncharacterized protein n=1 Tax=Schistosoma mattheei TaxID=31246 RepID=A0A183PCB0_9TREM|nr:unnamed protein product [Schistosoma mattheei]
MLTSPGGRERHETISGHVLYQIICSKPTLQSELNNLGVDMNLIRSLILGDTSTVLSQQDSLKNKSFIYEILSNSLNGMDVDKWDYLLRDCLHSGLGASGTSVDIDRFLRFYRPFLHTDKDKGDENESKCWHLSFRDTELENLLRTFSLRQHLHQKVYQHKTVTAISAMIIDALELIEPVLNLRSISMNALKYQNPDSLNDFLKLHDSLLWDVFYGRGSLSRFTSENFLSRIQQAQSLIRRILNRDLYTYIDSVYEMIYYAPIGENNSHPHSFNPKKFPNLINEVATESLTLRSMGLGLGPRKSLCYEPISPHYRTFGVTSNNKLRVIRAYRLYWRRTNSPLKSAIYCPVTCLTEAFNQWHQEMIEDRHGAESD